MADNDQIWVVKIGSALLAAEDGGLRHESITGWTRQIAQLRDRNIRCVLVSSGAALAGMTVLNWRDRAGDIVAMQAAAAVGQARLIRCYEECLSRYDMPVAQILLTHDDLHDRGRYLNARATLRLLLATGVVPVINENDTVATEEIQFGDNDTLAGLVANLMEANNLIIMTDREGLHEKNPASDPDAPLVREGRAGDPELESMAGAGSATGRGGMRTKLRAAAIAARSGTHTRILDGRHPDVLLTVAAGEQVGTYLRADEPVMTARKRWLAGTLRSAGQLRLDEGAVRHLRAHGKSLLPVGVVAVEGDFQRGSLVSLADAQTGEEIGHGLVNYDVDETRRIIGKPSSEIADRLGYVREAELIHRDNLVLL